MSLENPLGHRDISPENTVLSSNYMFKITFFNERQFFKGPKHLSALQLFDLSVKLRPPGEVII